jgi:hypothetical protein
MALAPDLIPGLTPFFNPHCPFCLQGLYNKDRERGHSAYPFTEHLLGVKACWRAGVGTGLRVAGQNATSMTWLRSPGLSEGCKGGAGGGEE